ncbi:MAG: pilus assembly protein PilB [Cyanobacteria bacterium P01_B01_bin.77]
MSTFPKNNALSPLTNSFQKTETKADLEQMFLLIEGILPFEACLYYQVLPLFIEGSTLNLGMVNPDDTTATDYVRRLVSYINCSIVSRPIASDWHREILSKFLSHSAKSRQASQSPQPQTQSAADVSFAEQPTLVVGAPTEIIENPIKTSAQPSSPLVPEAQLSPSGQESPVAPLTIELTEPATKTENKRESNQPADSTASTELNLNQTNPKELTQILLKRIITQEGIGRLYLERQSQACRILWSKDGVVQSVVSDISSQLFQGVINELKRMMSLSLIPVRKPKQIEIERIHNQKRILLRFRVMPGDHGEEATLQILRGAALKFYQQQQIDNIGRDALGLAHDLQQRIDELRAQAQRNLDVQDTKQKTLPAIMTMLKQMEQQLHEIIESSD